MESPISLSASGSALFCETDFGVFSLKFRIKDRDMSDDAETFGHETGLYSVAVMSVDVLLMNIPVGFCFIRKQLIYTRMGIVIGSILLEFLSLLQFPIQKFRIVFFYLDLKPGRIVDQIRGLLLVDLTANGLG